MDIEKKTRGRPRKHPEIPLINGEPKLKVIFFRLDANQSKEYENAIINAHENMKHEMTFKKKTCADGFNHILQYFNKVCSKKRKTKKKEIE